MIGGPPNATETTKGVVELATTVEAAAGTDTVRAVTPAGLAAGVAAIPGIGASETYGSGWNGDTSAPEKDDVYDYLHQIDTNDDGDVDTIDSTLWATKLNAAEKAAASGVASLNGSSLVVQNPANATATPTASKIPIADGSGKLTGWVDAATESVAGKVELATDAETVTGTATDKVTTPANLTAKMAAPGAIGGTTAAAGKFTTGNFSGQVDAPVTTTSHRATEVATAATMYGNVHKITGAYVVTLPAAVVGMSGTFRASTAAAFSVDCNGSDHFEMFDGTVMSAGEKLTSSGTKNEFVTIYCESANTWIVIGQNGAFTNGG
ncbi:MAG TPA: hypothetical protein DCR68_02310 [Coprothermobacter sp.]|nr:hypothetical protein [Coprothermobacter sp.]